jgi:hypothetical protein
MRTLTAAAVATTAFATIAFSSIASAQTAQQPDCDLEAIHKAYWSLGGSSSEQSLQQLEVEANKYYYGDDQVRIAASRPYLNGYPVTVISGYLERDNIDGLTDGDRVLFRFAQTAPMQGYSLPYEFIDGGGHVFYRGSRVVPRSPFWMSYYYRPAARISYYTPSHRIGYLRSYRIGWRMSPSYFTWRNRFHGFRASYGSRIAVMNRTYGSSRFVASFGHRPAFRSGFARPAVRTGFARPGYRTTISSRPAVRTTVRTTITSRPAYRTTVTRPAIRSQVTVRSSGGVRATVRTRR